MLVWIKHLHVKLVQFNNMMCVNGTFDTDNEHYKACISPHWP